MPQITDSRHRESAQIRDSKRQQQTTADSKLLSDLAHWQRIIQTLAQGSVIALLPCQCVKCALLHSVTHHHITDILIHILLYIIHTLHCTIHTIIYTIYTIPAHTVIYYTIQYSAYILIRSYTLMLRQHHHMICYYSIMTYTSYLYIRHLLPCLIL